MIRTRIAPENPQANLKSYYETYRSFLWSTVEREIFQDENGRINIVNEAVDRWAGHPDRQRQPALVFEKAGKAETFTYAELKEISCRWANFLVDRGFETGDRLVIFLRPCAQLYVAMLACARVGVLFSTIFPTLGFDELDWIFHNAAPRGVLTDPDLAERLPSGPMKDVEHLFLVGNEAPGMFSGETLVDCEIQQMPSDFTNRALPRETPLFLLYTSGSTGPPKGVIHAHQDMAGHLITARYVLDLHGDSILWTDGDPAWVTGTVYGAFAPWLCGCTSVIQADEFSASTWYRTLEKHHVTVWYTTPRNIRRLLEAGDDLPRRYDFSQLRHISTVGDTLTPELFFWAKEHLKRSPHDTWWMTETGMICIANFPSEPIKPGSMGKPVPGIEAAVVDRDGNPLMMLTLGELALKPGWPSMMRGLWRDEPRGLAYLRNGWFLTGDMVLKDEDGYYYHQGRNDDLIKVDQVTVGPYEVEQVLRQHPAVAEAAVIGKGAGAGRPTVKAFVKLDKQFNPSVRLSHEIRAFVKSNLHSQIPFNEMEFMDELPKTRSGKMLRRVLRARELGLPTGDPTKLQD
jgi:acetyl-CoA synthetase